MRCSAPRSLSKTHDLPPGRPSFITRVLGVDTAARKGPAFFAYSDNYLIDTDHGIIMDVEATRSLRQTEVGSTLTMLD